MVWKIRDDRNGYPSTTPFHIHRNGAGNLFLAVTTLWQVSLSYLIIILSYNIFESLVQKQFLATKRCCTLLLVGLNVFSNFAKRVEGVVILDDVSKACHKAAATLSHSVPVSKSRKLLDY